MALCSLFLIAGPKRLVNRSALRPPVPAATARGETPRGDVPGLGL